MKFGPATKLLIAIAIIFLSVPALSCSNDNGPSYIPPNQGVVNFKDFYVSSNSTELSTSASGTIFVEKDKSNYKAQIVAWVEIDPLDWGGVSFTIPLGWEITNLLGSYPDIGKSLWWITPFDKAPAEDVLDSYYWEQQIRIGDQTHHSWNTSGGSNGSIIIELTEYQKSQKPSNVFKIMVGVGSDERNGTKILYPDFETIEVPIIQQ